MTTYKYINDSVVSKIDDDGVSRRSCSIQDLDYIAWIAEGNTPEPAAPIPNPRIGQIKAELLALDVKKIRPLAEGDTAYLATLNAQTLALRSELQTLDLTL